MQLIPELLLVPSREGGDRVQCCEVAPQSLPFGLTQVNCLRERSRRSPGRDGARQVLDLRVQPRDGGLDPRLLTFLPAGKERIKVLPARGERTYTNRYLVLSSIANWNSGPDPTTIHAKSPKGSPGISIVAYTRTNSFAEEIGAGMQDGSPPSTFVAMMGA